MNTLAIHTQEDEQRQLAVTVEVAEDRVKKAMRSTARDMAKRVRIPGFRPGKAPYRVVVNMAGGEKALREDTVNDMLDDLFREVMEEIEAEPYAQPTLDEIEYEPVVLKLTVPLEPIVELGDYRSERKEVLFPEVSDEALDEALERVRESHAVVEPVDRPIELEDVVVFSGEGHFDDADREAEDYEPFFKEENFEATVGPDAVFRNTRFAEHLMGLSAGDSVEFSLTFAEDYEVDDWAGRTATFNVDILDVKERTLPELDDELAQLEGEFETLDELRESVAADLAEQAEMQFRNDTRDEWVTMLIDGVEELVYPPGAVAAEVDRRLEQLKNQYAQMGLEWERVLQLMGRSEEEQRDELEESAVEALEQRLVLQAFITKEKLRVDDEEIEPALERFVTQRYEEGEMRDAMRQYLQEAGIGIILDDLIMEKVHERVLAILAGEAPDLAELENAAEDAAESDEEADEETEAAEEAAKPEAVTAAEPVADASDDAVESAASSDED